jgi:hypothetical protein
MGVIRPALIVFVVLVVLTFGYADIGGQKVATGKRSELTVAHLETLGITVR